MLNLLTPKVKSVIIFCFFSVIKYGLVAQEQEDKLDWSADLDYLKEHVYKTFPQAKERIPLNEFNLRLAQIKFKAPSLSKEEMAVEIMWLLALTNDNDCFVHPFQDALNTRILPLKTYFFSNGLYVCDAAEPYTELIGEKIDQIGNLKVEDLFKKLQTVIPSDNEHYQRYQFSLYSQLPNFLIWAGAIESNKEVSILTSSNVSKIVAFRDFSSYLKLDRTLASQVKLENSNVNHYNENYWMEDLQDQKSLFIQLKAIKDEKEGKTFSEFVKEIEARIKSGKVEKVIIDNRYGGGGNGFKLVGFIKLLRESKTINQKGKLFVLTSRSTKGALLEFTSILQLNTKAIIVGEPSGEGPNTVGDRITVTLPNSKLEVQLTKLFWPTSFEFDNRKTIQAQLLVNYTFEDYLAKKDPWLNSVEDFRLTSTLNQVPDLNLQAELSGNYRLDGYTLKLYQKDGKLYAEVKKKMRSFFELHTELYQAHAGVLSSDIPQLRLLYEKKNDKSILTKLKWFGKPYELK